MAQRSLPQRVWYDFLRVLCRLLATVVFRIRILGREHVPATGGVLVVSNHQSHLDPILVGLAFDRRLNFVARDTLFGFAPFRWLINSLDAIPIDREGIGLGGIKESLRRLRDQEVLGIFPEGTRTRDGEVGVIKPGFLVLARRSRVPILPVAIEGAYQAWPRRNWLPRPGHVCIEIGQPIQPIEAAEMSDEQLLAEVERRIRRCHQRARRLRRRTDDPLGSRDKAGLKLAVESSGRPTSTYWQDCG